ALIHVTVLHLLLNIFVIAAFGRLVMLLSQSTPFAVAVFITSIAAGSLLACVMAPATVVAGASGGAVGLVAACVPLSAGLAPRRWLLFQITQLGALVSLGLLPFIAGWSHVGGALAGLTLGAVWRVAVIRTRALAVSFGSKESVDAVVRAD